MSNKYVSIKALNVKFKEEILRDLFLEIEKGEFVSIVGKSGVGKTTLLNALAGIVDYKGNVKKPGNVGFVFQHRSLFPWMTVKENIAFGIRSKGEETVKEIINSTGLQGKESDYPHQLSGGQQQRVAIGRALATKPDLLLLDEPFASLDSYTRLEMQDWVNNVLRKNKTTTILVTHDVDEAILLSDRVLVMKNKTLELEHTVPLTRPRNSDSRYSTQFQELKRTILLTY